MREPIWAIDLLFHATARRQAESGRNCFQDPQRALAAMDAAGIERAFVSQCKKWSCERQWMCVDTRLDDVLHYTQASPRFLGLAGYNPYDIAESMREMELAVARHGFRGVFLHAAGFGLSLADALVYPLFAKATELGVPVVAELAESDGVMVTALLRLAADFPELVLVLAPPRPDVEQISAFAAAGENICFALSPGALAHLAAQSQAADFFAGSIFQERCMWGSDGLVAPPLSLPVLERQGGDSSASVQNFLRDNAIRLFALDRPLPARTPRSAMHEILAGER